MNILLLPNELLFKIIKFCEIRDLPNVSKTCKRWNEICQSEKLWTFRCLKDYNVTGKGGQFKTFKELYTVLLHKYGHLIGTYKFKFFSYGGLLEIDFQDSLNVWHYKQIGRDEKKSLMRYILFKIEKDSQENKVNILCCYQTENHHKGILKKSGKGRRYIFKCGDAYANHGLKPGDQILFNSYITHGLELFPIYVQEVSDVPKSLLLENGELPDRLVKPGLYRALNKIIDDKIMLLTYKDNLKISGFLVSSEFSYGGEIVLKVNLGSVDIPQNIDVITYGLEIYQSEYKLPEQSKEIFGRKCKFWYNAFSMVVGTGQFTVSYFMVFDHDHFIVFEPNCNKFMFFERICQQFNKKRGFCIYENQ